MNGLLAAAVLVAGSGCFSRELTIRSDPPGARVYRDREHLGTTPVTVPFHYGGKSALLLLHEEGEIKYKPTRVLYDTSSFVYDAFPFDVLIEMTPVPMRDDHTIDVVLEEDTTVDVVEGDPDGVVEALLERAAEMRERARTAAELGPPPEAPLFSPDDDELVPDEEK